jgi:hypothetical protein
LGATSLVVLTDTAFEPGTAVTIQAKNHQFKGSVANSEFDGCLGYYLEVRLARDSYWSDRLFQPQHLTKLIALEESSVTEKVIPDFSAQRSITCARAACAGNNRRPRRTHRPVWRSSARRCHLVRQ